MSSLPPKKGRRSRNGTRDKTVYRITRTCGGGKGQNEEKNEHRFRAVLLLLFVCVLFACGCCAVGCVLAFLRSVVGKYLQGDLPRSVD